MAIPDEKYMITSSEDHSVKQWSLKKMCLENSWGKLHKSWIDSMVLSSCGKYLFTADRIGHLKQWNLKKRNLIKDFGEIHNGRVGAIFSD